MSATSRRFGVPSPAAGDHAILPAKLVAPLLPGWIVARPRVENLITPGAKGPVTVLTGPPGAGKTIALASWAASAPGPLAWLTLDEYDNEPGVFWPHVAEALRRIVARPPDGVRSEWPAGAVMVHPLAAALAGYDRDVVLVLDDFHHVTSRECLDGIEYLAHYAGRLHLLVASRMDPLLHLQRLRVSGELTEIRARDLAFTLAETGELLEQHGIELPAGPLEVLTRRSEGWAAGLRLAALSMRDCADAERVVKDFAAADGPVAAYLIDELLDRQSAEIRRLMLRTSVVDQVSAGLASELAGDEGAGASWPALVRAIPFVQPVGPGWYRWYPPLAEVLRLKLQEECPDEVRVLRLRAARWLYGHGSLAEAVRLAGAAGDWPLAARMVVDDLAVGQLIDPGASQLLADALTGQRAAVAAHEPSSLLVAAAIAIRTRRDAAARTLLRAARRAMPPSSPDDRHLPARLAAATIALELARRSGDLPAAQAEAAEACRVLGRLPGTQVRPGVRAEVLATAGLVEMWADRFDAAAEDGGSSAAWKADASSSRALSEAVQGRLGQAVALAGSTGQHREDAAAAVALAWARVERGQFSTARTELARAEQALAERPDRFVAALCHVVEARYRLARGQPQRAAEVAGAVRSGWAPPRWLDQMLAAAQVRGLTATGDIPTAVRSSDGACGADGASEPELAAALARAWQATGKLARAGDAVAAAKAASARRGWSPGRVEAELADAELAYARGDAAYGRRRLQEALRIAGPEQIRLPFTLGQTWIQPVLRRDQQLAGEFARAFGTRPPGSPAARSGGSAPPRPVVVEQLSGREREVLGYVSEMLSTAEIAEEMYLSVNTIKSHLRTILRKLGARHRREAVRRARELQLL